MIISHDFHLHTNLSLCADKEATVALYVQKAKELGLKKIAITNHMWDHKIDGWHNFDPSKDEFYEVQTYEYVEKIKKEITNFKNAEVQIYFGCEAEYSFKSRCPAISPQTAEKMDVLLVPNSHTHLTMPKNFYYPHRKHIDFMIDSFMDIINSEVAEFITAVPHPFLAVACPYDNRELLCEMTDDDFKRCFSAAAEKGIALEINPSFIRGKSLCEAYDDPIFRMYRIAKECGCLFTVGSDSHSEKGFDGFERIYLLTAVLGLTEQNFHPLTRTI